MKHVIFILFVLGSTFTIIVNDGDYIRGIWVLLIGFWFSNVFDK